LAKENKNIALYIDGILVDIFYYDDESFINQYAYKKYLIRYNNSLVFFSTALKPDYFNTMKVHFKDIFDEAKKILRKLKLEKMMID
jgi:hypothetical protein